MALEVGLPVVRVGEIPLKEAAGRWMIEGLWGAASVGIIGGSPKSCKSWLGLDMAVSVATGTSCLGIYRVEESGPALVYLAEDALATVRERIRGIARSRALGIEALNIYAITAPSLQLDRPKDRQRLRETAERLRPRLLLLDPLVRLHGVDENNATDMAQLLSYFRELQRSLDLSVVLIHHTRKNVPAGLQAGQGLRGSSDLHAFGDSNLYLRRSRDALVLSMEHRSAAAPEPVTLQLATEDSAAIHLEIGGKELPRPSDEKPDLKDAVLRALESVPAVTRGNLRAKLAVNNERLGQALATLQEEGKVEHGPEGWRKAGAKATESFRSAHL